MRSRRKSLWRRCRSCQFRYHSKESNHPDGFDNPGHRESPPPDKWSSNHHHPWWTVYEGVRSCLASGSRYVGFHRFRPNTRFHYYQAPKQWHLHRPYWLHQRVLCAGMSGETFMVMAKVGITIKRNVRHMIDMQPRPLHLRPWLNVASGFARKRVSKTTTWLAVSEAATNFSQGLRTWRGKKTTNQSKAIRKSYYLTATVFMSICLELKRIKGSRDLVSNTRMIPSSLVPMARKEPLGAMERQVTSVRGSAA